MAAGRQQNELFSLIESLSPQEKTFFKAYSLNNKASEGDPAFLILFDVMNSMDHFDQNLLKTELKKKGFKANYFKIQTYLTEAILNALEGYHAESEATIRANKLLIQAQLLLKKNLSRMAGKYIDRARKLIVSGSFHEYNLLADHLEFTLIEKNEKSQDAYRDLVNKDLERFRLETELRLLGVRSLHHALDFFDRQVPLQRIKSEVQKTLSGLQLIRSKLQLTHFSRSRFYNSMIQCLLVLQKKKELNDILKDYTQYVKQLTNKTAFEVRTALHGFNSVMIAQIHSSQFESAEKTYTLAEHFFVSVPGKFKTPDICSLFYSYVVENILACYNETGKPELTLALWDKFRKEIVQYNRQNTGSLYQINVAYAAFMNGDAHNAIRSAQKIELDKTRPAAFCQARLLIVLSHFDLGNYEILPALVKQTIKEFSRHSVGGKNELLILNALPSVLKGKNAGDLFKELADHMESFDDKNAYHFTPGSIDLLSWVRSKLSRKTLKILVGERSTTPRFK